MHALLCRRVQFFIITRQGEGTMLFFAFIAVEGIKPKCACRRGRVRPGRGREGANSNHRARCNIKRGTAAGRSKGAMSTHLAFLTFLQLSLVLNVFQSSLMSCAE